MSETSIGLRSMTGYGQASREQERFAFTVQARSVNHRYLDLKIRLEEPFQASEAPLRELFGEELHRGRIDVTVQIRSLEPRQAAVEVHHEVLASIHGALSGLQEAGRIHGELSADSLLRLPEVFRVEILPPEWAESDQQTLLQVAQEALAQLVASRRLEGEKLARTLEVRVEELETLSSTLREQRREALAEFHAALSKRLDELLENRNMSPERLEQEAAVIADRSDVQEELDRLDSHLEHFRSLLSAERGAGKRLDFLSQEILRELNTLGAKCRNAEMTRSVVDAKTVCEQLREQVQNIE